MATAGLKMLDAEGTYVEGIKEEVVLFPGHALSLIVAGEDESSSHGEDYDVVIFSQLNLIDLAGSESSKNETTGLRRNEGSYINKSLKTFGTRGVPEEPFRQVTSALIIELNHGFVAMHAIGLRRDLKTFLIQGYELHAHPDASAWFRNLRSNCERSALSRKGHRVLSNKNKLVLSYMRSSFIVKDFEETIKKIKVKVKGVNNLLGSYTSLWILMTKAKQSYYLAFNFQATPFPKMFVNKQRTVKKTSEFLEKGSSKNYLHKSLHKAYFSEYHFMSTKVYQEKIVACSWVV
ncbi:hypothetical protein Fmac_018888 [Flemingia macrophylla]|uniref:Kinesin motor domain-containing protein n=1 Tax=Flemingia macrophylla TaxID=520843 RepID=A0ABD1M6N7_9FABA